MARSVRSFSQCAVRTAGQFATYLIICLASAAPHRKPQIVTNQHCYTPAFIVRDEPICPCCENFLFSCHAKEMPLIVMGPFTRRAYHISAIVQVARRSADFETAHEEGLIRLGPSSSSYSLMSRARLVLGRPLRNGEARTPHLYQNPDLRL
jgi:hypothetical protein